MIRFAGHLRIRAAVRDGKTRLAEQSFQAPFHLSKPYWDPDSHTLHVQVVNPTAGVLAGDRLSSQIGVDPGASLLVTTPSATRVFTMADGLAECHQNFTIHRGAWLEITPEPLVPHRGSNYRQVTQVEIEAGGGLFFVDQLMPGRIGHGESWAWKELCLELDVCLGGGLILRERFVHSGPALRALAESAGSGSSACFANAVLVSPDENAAAPWRETVHALHNNGVWIGVSALRRSGWSIKIVAPDAVRLRGTLRQVRQILAGFFPALRTNLRRV